MEMNHVKMWILHYATNSLHVSVANDIVRRIPFENPLL
jgi:hypothetical protein